MKVRTGAPARASDQGDEVAALDAITLAHIQLRQMTIGRANTVAMIDDNTIAEQVLTAGEDDLPAGRCNDSRSICGADIDPGVKLTLIGKWRDPWTKREVNQPFTGQIEGVAAKRRL